MDKIYIKNLEIFANHGVFPEENTLGQKFIVSAILYTSTRKAGLTDDLTASIHYGEVSHFIKDFLQKNTYKLLERAVEQLAEEMLCKISGLSKVTLEIKKPWAPIALPVETVSVEITRQWHVAYLSIGSNMGDRKAYLDMAIEELQRTKTCEVKTISQYYETEPYGDVKQDDFLNACLEVRTLLPPFELLDRLHEIEQLANRERKIHWGPRTLDMDIIFYDNLVLDSKELQIPHPQMALREFVLEPLSEIAPWYRHPLFNKTVVQLLEELKKEEK